MTLLLISLYLRANSNLLGHFRGHNVDIQEAAYRLNIALPRICPFLPSCDFNMWLFLQTWIRWNLLFSILPSAWCQLPCWLHAVVVFTIMIIIPVCQSVCVTLLHVGIFLDLFWSCCVFCWFVRFWNLHKNIEKTDDLEGRCTSML